MKGMILKMNMNLNYYDACYKICALSTILNSSKENVVAINDNLIAKTKFTLHDGLGAWSNFQIVFFRDGKIIEEVTFDNNADKALKLQRKFHALHLQQNSNGQQHHYLKTELILYYHP